MAGARPIGRAAADAWIWSRRRVKLGWNPATPCTELHRVLLEARRSTISRSWPSTRARRRGGRRRSSAPGSSSTVPRPVQSGPCATTPTRASAAGCSPGESTTLLTGSVRRSGSGSSATICVPAARRRDDCQPPAERRHPVGEADEPRSAGVCASAPVVLDGRAGRGRRARPVRRGSRARRRA